MKVIFLDIDGVLNRRGWMVKKTPWLEDSKLKLISNLCKETGAKIVLATNWRETWFEPMFYDNETTAIYTGHKLFDENEIEVIGITDRIGSRGDEIKKYLLNHPEITNYVSIDDSIVEVDNFVQTEPEIGLTEEDCRKAASFLQLH